MIRKFSSIKFKTKSTTKYSTVVTSKKNTLLDLKRKFNERKPISMLTAYDYTSSKLVSDAGIDMILVGDSLGMVMLGRENTVSVTMEEMILHCKSVSRGSTTPFLVGDMPYGSYEISTEAAIQNAIRFLKEGNMDAIKIEADKSLASRIESIVKAGIPVV
jgi:3-methyl-2-oxobutanoate hydroxymethyltransferase